jgi:DnaJ-class molecular chaperone
MQFKDYYQILNVSRDASAEDIKRMFRQLAMQYHPDRNPEDVRVAGEKFKEINEAYEVLGDEQKRWQYDRLVNPSSNPRNTMHAEDFFTDEMEADSIMEMLRRMAGSNFVVRQTGWRKPWGCGRRRGGQCRHQYRQEY